MKQVRHWLFVAILSFSGAIAVQAQTNLSGRVYYSDNIMEKEIQEMTKDLDKDLKEAKVEAIKKGEEKKGRKLTEAELAELEKELEKARKLTQALKTGMKTAITVTFKDEKNIVVDVDMKIEDSVLKAAGVSWAKRKLIKMGTKLAPSQKGTYTVKGNQVIVVDGAERDTMRLSDDGKFLYGKMDEKTKFRLTRTK